MNAWIAAENDKWTDEWLAAGFLTIPWLRHICRLVVTASAEKPTIGGIESTDDGDGDNDGDEEEEGEEEEASTWLFSLLASERRKENMSRTLKTVLEERKEEPRAETGQPWESWKGSNQRVS